MNKYLLFIIFLGFGFSIHASDSVVLTKYAYGALYWAGKRHEIASVYRIEDTPGYDYSQGGGVYSIGDNESDDLKKDNNVNLFLNVYSNPHDIFAEVHVNNKNGKYSFFISRKNIPLNDRVMCENMFRITTENIKLDYLGDVCDFGDELNKNSWVEIKPMGKYVFKVKLNDFYKFVPGNHRYDIGSLEFMIVNEKWFIDSSINEHLFDILSGNIYGELPSSEESSANIIDFLYDLQLYSNTYNAFTVRTKQIIVDINGDNVRDNPCFYGRCRR